MKTVFPVFLFFITFSYAFSGLFTGIAVVDGGLVVLQPAESGVGSGRVVNEVRIELGDIIKVGEDGQCTVLFIDGTSVRLDTNSDYRVRRNGLWKLLDGGEMIVADFKVKLGSRTQKLPVNRAVTAIGEVFPFGECHYRSAAGEKWSKVEKSRVLHAGDVVKTGKDCHAFVLSHKGELKAFIEPETVFYCLHGGMNFESGGGLLIASPRATDFLFDASMSRIRPRAQEVIFRFRELPDGAWLDVYEGRIQLSLKAQGLPISKTLSNGWGTVLRRSGAIDKPLRRESYQLEASQIPVLLKAFESKSVNEVITFLAGTVKVGTAPEEEKTPGGIPEDVVPKPQIPKEPAPVPSKNSSAPVPGQGDLEKLFTLPRMGGTDSRKARP